MIQLSVQVRNARLVEKKHEDLTKEIVDISRGRIYGRLTGTAKKMMTYPAPYAGQPKHEWVSEKQRRYVMWAIKTGLIKVPYQRTQKYANAWRVIRLENGYMLTNLMPYARWVGGTARGGAQARIHQTRWLIMRDVIEESLQGLPKDIQDHITMVSRKRGF